jgi:hypothetical protein
VAIVADINDGTVEGCVEFLGYTIKHGYLNKNTASAIRTGVKRIQTEVPDISEADLRTMNVDEAMSRFRTLARGKDIKQQSIDEYERRFRQARDLYLKFLNHEDWMTPQRTRASSNGQGDRPRASRQRAASGDVVASNAEVPFLTGPGLITYPFPIRAGLQGKITLPENLTSREAERISAFVKTLSMEGDTV